MGDLINVDIRPDDTTTTTTIYVRKTIYQKLKLNTPVYNKILNDSGVGRVVVLNSGADYAYDSSGNATYTNVELIFSDQTKCRGETEQIVTDLNNAVIGNPGNTNNARATIRVTNGLVTSVQITSKGRFYKKGDILTATPGSIYRNPSSSTSRFLTIEVDHAGFAATNTRLFLNEVSSISNNDLLQIGTEIVKVTSIDTFTNSVVVQRVSRKY